jgi:hypothetical protein
LPVLNGVQGVRFVVSWRDELLAGMEDGKLRRVADGALGEERVAARLACVAGADLLLVRIDPALLGGGWPAHDTCRLFRQAPDGTTREVADLGQGSVQRVAADAVGRRAIVQMARMSVDGAVESNSLREVDLATGAVAGIGQWDAISYVAASAEGWLISGSPRGEPVGVWMIGADGRSELLVAGPVQGLGVDGTTLLLAEPAHDQQITVRRVALAECREEGRWCQPFGARQLDTVGRLLLAEPEIAPPRTREQLAAVWQRADAIARDHVGAGLPTTPGEVDGLLNHGVGWQSGLDRHGRIVIGLLLANAAIGAGGQWVEPAEADWLHWCMPPRTTPDTAFAICSQPATDIVAALDDSEGQADLAGRLTNARGRAVLVGVDAEALAARASSLAPAELESVVRRGDGERLEALFGQFESNAELRTWVYDQMAAHGHLAVVEQLAKSQARRSPPLAADALAWVRAWQRRDVAGAQASERVEVLMDLVRQLPGEAPLYLALGTAVESAFAGDGLKARQCYLRVLDLQQWGPDADAAKAALSRLGY